MKFARIIAVLIALAFLGIAGTAAALVGMSSSLPQIIKVEDYKPLLVSEVFARDGRKIGEYAIEKRTLTPFDKIPMKLADAFIAAEDDTFYEHGGVNYVAMLRAFVVNMAAGKKKQGASTITQQVAKTLLLSSEKTYTRKIKEILLSQRMEENLSKQDILYLYLNQIYFGENAYGVTAAADTYFRKTLDKLTIGEMALLAGLPQAPSKYSPSDHPQEAKARQRYVLSRMHATGKITEAEMKSAGEEPITVYYSREDRPVAPYFVETLRQMLVGVVGEKALWQEGLKIYTSIDYDAQVRANESVQAGLKALDKRQGYRGAAQNIATPEDQTKFLLRSRKILMAGVAPSRVIMPDGNFQPEKELTPYHKKDGSGRIITNVPEYIPKGTTVDAIVSKVDDGTGLVTVTFADGQGLIDIEEMNWARKPDPNSNAERAAKITKPSAALKVGDAILVKVHGDKFASTRIAKMKKRPANAPNFEEYAHLQLEQRPLVQGALLSFDQQTSEVIAMVGGYEYVHKTQARDGRGADELNRTIQARRQTGSAFKTIVYASALDRGYTPASPIQDAPMVFQGEDEGQEEGKTWKPHNHGQKFEGDILFRKALIRSLNIPTVKILEDVGVTWALDYAKRLGIFSPLNPDLSLGLGSSSLTLYEMTKSFSHFGRLGKRMKPLIVKKVVDQTGKVLLENLTLDARFEREIGDTESSLKQKSEILKKHPSFARTVTVNGVEPGPPYTSSFLFDDPNQLIRPQTAYLMTTILSGVINEEGGTAGKALALGRAVAGKTGSTNNYFDGWFLGYTPQIVTGVWVGYDEEKSLGLGEVGGDTALPIWVEYMKAAHEKLPAQEFSVPPGIVFANIDGQTGNLASASSSSVVRQAFIEGTEPKTLSGAPSSQDESEFLKKDLTD